MIKRLLLFLMLLIPIISQPVCSPHSNCVCDKHQVDLLRQNNWIVVPWDTGQCYFHNFVTRENRDDVPIALRKRMADFTFE